MMEGYADIEGPVRIGFLHWVLLALALLGVLALMVLAIAWWRKRRASGRTPGIDVRRNPLEIAMERLQRLGGEKMEMDAEPFTVEVSDIVRDYLEEALEIPAREQTSEEFLGTIQTRPGLPSVLQEHMPTFLEQCDRVKFARQSLAGSQRDRLLDTAGTVVESTDRELQRQTDEEQPRTTTV